LSLLSPSSLTALRVGAAMISTSRGLTSTSAEATVAEPSRVMVLQAALLQ
jgi:hypothetical protein